MRLTFVQTRADLIIKNIDSNREEIKETENKLRRLIYLFFAVKTTIIALKVTQFLKLNLKRFNHTAREAKP